MHIGFPAEPRQLALREKRRALTLAGFGANGFSFRDFARNVVAKLRVADELERLRISRHAAQSQPGYFFDPARPPDHRLHACVNSRVEHSARVGRSPIFVTR